MSMPKRLRTVGEWGSKYFEIYTRWVDDAEDLHYYSEVQKRHRETSIDICSWWRVEQDGMFGLCWIMMTVPRMNPGGSIASLDTYNL